MTNWWLLYVYGLVMLAAVCNTPTWWWLSYQAFRDRVERRFLFARLALAFINLTVVLAICARASLAAIDAAAKFPSVPLLVGVRRHLQY